MKTFVKLFSTVLFCSAMSAQTFAQPAPNNRNFVLQLEDGPKTYSDLLKVPSQFRACLDEQLDMVLQWLSRNPNVAVTDLTIEKSKKSGGPGIEFDKRSGKLLVRTSELKDGRCVVRSFKNFDSFFSSSTDESAAPNH